MLFFYDYRVFLFGLFNKVFRIQTANQLHILKQRKDF